MKTFVFFNSKHNSRVWLKAYSLENAWLQIKSEYRHESAYLGCDD